MFVKIYRRTQRQALEWSFKKAGLEASYGHLAVLLGLAFRDCGQDAHGINALMHMQTDGVNFETGALGLAGPLQIGCAHASQFFQCVAHGGGVVTG